MIVLLLFAKNQATRQLFPPAPLRVASRYAKGGREGVIIDYERRVVYVGEFSAYAF
jgi:hypothetical protein